MKLKILCVSPLLALSLLAFAPTAAAQDDDKRFTFTPYLWLPTVDGDLRFSIPPGASGSPDIGVGPVDYLENLQLTFMLQGEARFNRFAVFTDFIYLDFSDEDGSVNRITGPGPLEIPIDVGTRTSFTAWLWTLEGGYDVVRNENLRLHAFGGFRYLDADASADVHLAGPLALFPQDVHISRDAQLWDGVVGVRGEGRAGNWVFPYYADIGAGSSELTYQASAGVGYRWGWGDLHLDYRYLKYEQGGNDLIQDLSLSGPQIGATFRF
jgi:hypothetical protein